MTTQAPSGTSVAFLTNVDVVLEAFSRIGIQPAEITREHMFSCKRSLNLELQTWSNRGLNLWRVEPFSIPLVQSTANYALPATTIGLLDTYITINSTTTPIDRMLTPMGRSEYAAIPNKTMEAPPTGIWFDRQAPIPDLTLWPTPDGATTYTLNGFLLQQIQDASPINAQTAQIPYRHQEALCAGLAKRLAMKYSPSKFPLMKQEANEEWNEASTEDREKVGISVVPELSSYFRV